FRNSTADKTRAELQADMEKVKAGVRDAGKVDTPQKETTLGLIGDGVTQAGVSYEDVPGVGDEARIEKGNGSLTVRVKNLSFTVRGYKGRAFEPPVTKLGTTPQQIREMMATTQAAQRKFHEETFA